VYIYIRWPISLSVMSVKLQNYMFCVVHMRLKEGNTIPVTCHGGLLGLWDDETPTFSRQLAHRGWWDCQPYALASFYPPGRFLVPISVRGWVDPRAIVQLEELEQLKNPMISSGIELVTFQLVAQCLNKLRYHMPSCHTYTFYNF
jgi:hypothetical protein